MKELKSAIGYVRVSTDAQANDDKFGVDVQKREILMYADANGYSIVDWKIDTFSGAKDGRPELDKILYGNEISNPPIDAVIAFKVDRVARDTKLYFYYLYTLERRKIKLLSVDERFAEGDEFAGIYRSLLLFVAEQERKNIATRTGKGRSLKASCGGYSGGRAPYGYKVQNGMLVVNEDERSLVEEIFRMRDSGAILVDIVDGLYDMGYRTRQGKRFQITTIRSVLDNRKTYQGFYKYGKEGKWVVGVHEPILKEVV